MRTSICILFLSILFAGCSTQNSRFVNRAYHTVNAKYNGYFNARESYREGLKRLENAHQDNYEEILSIFRYGGEQDARSIESNMNIAYEKSSIVIQRHSMNIRGVEYNTMIDDAYFLIARAHFFKRNFNLAILTFEYIIRQYDTPLKYESKIWIAKSYNALGRYDNARQVLELIQRNYENGELPEESYRLFYLVYADYFYEQQRYSEAIPYIEKAIETTRNRNARTRLVFILGQTYQEIGDYANAQKTYARVLRLNPDFDMEFRARINMAMSYDPQVGGGEEIRDRLLRMLSRDRNRQYRDQIYYALGKLSENEGKIEKAIEYYKKSTQVSEDNDIQKGISFLRLGQLYYDKEEYYESHKYYDSTVTFISSDYENYDDIIFKRNVLNDLAMNIRLIKMEDSLQYLASLSEVERNIIINDIVERERERERLEREKMRAGQLTGRTAQQGMIGDESGGWYFYNPTAINFGQTEFAARWGDRKLEDLWRISNKRTYSFDDMAMGDSDFYDEFEEEEVSTINRESLLVNIPLSPEKIKESDDRILNAYYNKGIIYKDRLNIENKAIEAFEELLKRFPDNEHVLHSSYFLYDLFSKNNNFAKADFYKNKIINEFPDTDFAKILFDPDYVKNLQERYRQEAQLYESAYKEYINQNFNKVLDYCYRADTVELNRELAAKFAFLKAIAYGSLGHNRDFHEGLTNVINNYQGTDVYQPAENLLAFLSEDDSFMFAYYQRTGNDGDRQKDYSATIDSDKPFDNYETDIAEADIYVRPEDFFSIFKYKPETIHFFVYIVNTDEIEIRQLRNTVNEFNRATFPDRNLTLSNIFLEDRKQILTVTNFENDVKAMDYYNELTKSNRLDAYNKSHLKPFVISVENYPVFYQNKNIDEYVAFFNYYYLR